MGSYLRQAHLRPVFYVLHSLFCVNTPLTFKNEMFLIKPLTKLQIIKFKSLKNILYVHILIYYNNAKLNTNRNKNKRRRAKPTTAER